MAIPQITQRSICASAGRGLILAAEERFWPIVFALICASSGSFSQKGIKAVLENGLWMLEYRLEATLVVFNRLTKG